MNSTFSETVVTAAEKTAEGLSKVHPVIGATVGAAILLVAFGASGIGRIIEKGIESKKDK